MKETVTLRAPIFYENLLKILDEKKPNIHTYFDEFKKTLEEDDQGHKGAAFIDSELCNDYKKELQKFHETWEKVKRLHKLSKAIVEVDKYASELLD